MNSLSRFSFSQQWGHLAGEIIRARKRMEIQDKDAYTSSLARALMLTDQMIENYLSEKQQIKELLRARDIIAGYYADIDGTVPLRFLEEYCNQLLKMRRNRGI